MHLDHGRAVHCVHGACLSFCLSFSPGHMPHSGQTGAAERCDNTRYTWSGMSRTYPDRSMHAVKACIRCSGQARTRPRHGCRLLVAWAGCRQLQTASHGVIEKPEENARGAAVRRGLVRRPFYGHRAHNRCSALCCPAGQVWAARMMLGWNTGRRRLRRPGPRVAGPWGCGRWPSSWPDRRRRCR